MLMMYSILNKLDFENMAENFTALRRDTDIANKLIYVPCFQNQACSKLNTSLTLEPNAQKLYDNILSHIFTFSLGKRVQYQCYQNPPTTMQWCGKDLF